MYRCINIQFVKFICLNFCVQGHEDRYSIYIHASRERPVHSSSLFVGREIHSEKVLMFTPTLCTCLFLFLLYLNSSAQQGVMNNKKCCYALTTVPFVYTKKEENCVIAWISFR